MWKRIIIVLCAILSVSMLFAFFTFGRLYQADKDLKSTTAFYQENIYRMLEESI